MPMSMPSPVTKELLFTYFAGQATVLQKEMIRTWLSVEANQEFYYNCLMDWERRNLQYSVDTAAALARFQARLDGEERGQTKEFNTEPVVRSIGFAPSRKSAQPYRWLAAACAVLAIGAAAWLMRDPLLNETYQTAYGQTRVLQLEDGSQVTLNANSELKVPRWGFASSERRVYLRGEAAFSVVHTFDDKRFVVASDSGFQVQVLGTQFDMLARPHKNKVVLIHGKVRVDYGQLAGGLARPTIMAPGDVVEVQKGADKPSIEHVTDPASHIAWSQHRFVFANTSLSEVAEMIYDSYGIKVQVDGPALEKDAITGSFQASSAEELVAVVSKVLNVHVRKSGNTYHLQEQSSHESVPNPDRAP